MIPAKLFRLMRSGYYWIIDQIIAKGLHKSDNESMDYTTNLMDKLEQVGL